MAQTKIPESYVGEFGDWESEELQAHVSSNRLTVDSSCIALCRRALRPGAICSHASRIISLCRSVPAQTSIRTRTGGERGLGTNNSSRARFAEAFSPPHLVHSTLGYLVSLVCVTRPNRFKRTEAEKRPSQS